MTNKLPPAKDWRNRRIEDWNTLSFTEYLKDKHRELFGIEYSPMRGWRMEQGQIGSLIGTKSKAGSHSKEVVKEFIDEAFRTYKPTPQYPGTNFGFIYAYRRNLLQQIEARKQAEAKRMEEGIRQADIARENLEDIMDWL